MSLSSSPGIGEDASLLLGLGWPSEDTEEHELFPQNITFEQILSNLKTKPVPQPRPGTTNGSQSNSTGPLFTGGYDDEIFVNCPSKDFQCIVCLMVVREPHLITCCGAIICKVCMSLSNAKAECPQCRDTADHVVVPDKRTRGQTMSLQVKCTNTGCQWTGELLDYHVHVNEKCSMCSVACKYKCGQYFRAVDIAIHEEADCTNRSYDVIMRYQKKLVEAMLDMKDRQIEQVIEEMANGMKKIELNNQSLKKDLADLKEKSSKQKDVKSKMHTSLYANSTEGLPKPREIELCFDSSTITCPSCYFPFCKNCFNPAHGSNTDSMKKVKPPDTHAKVPAASVKQARKTSIEQTKTRQLYGSSENLKHCPNCGTINKSQTSCNHMSCTRCRHQFCGLCMIPWGGGCQEAHWFGPLK